MSTTISRGHTRKIAEIKAQRLTCVVFSLRNDFWPTPCNPSYAWEDLARGLHARLTVNAAGDVWTVHVHGNLWYELRKAPELADEYSLVIDRGVIGDQYPHLATAAGPICGARLRGDGHRVMVLARGDVAAHRDNLCTYCRDQIVPLRIAIDADCPRCGWGERFFEPGRGVFGCTRRTDPCGYESKERER